MAGVGYLLAYAFIFSTSNLFFATQILEREQELHGNRIFILSLSLAICTILSNALYPVTLHATFNQDTQFWRGIGARNKGIVISEEEQLQAVDVQVASTIMQDMMGEVGETLIDFCYLSIGKIVGRGATSKVYNGKYKGKPVAIKVLTPQELSDDIINDFVDETKIMRGINHPCVLKFYGICVRPPQIGLVLEFCQFGTLKSCIQENKLLWTPYRKIKTALDCATAVAYLHSINIIHRDLKCDNFFVDDELNVKLGDFGESTVKKKVEDTERKMTILGTVAYMAPELVLGDKSYTEAVDVYALALTIWEVWTLSEPFAEVKNFLHIYDKVQRGERPLWPPNPPSELVKVVELAWDQIPQNRSKSSEVQEKLQDILKSYKPDENNKSSKYSEESQFWSMICCFRNGIANSINFNINSISAELESTSSPIQIESKSTV